MTQAVDIAMKAGERTKRTKRTGKKRFNTVLLIMPLFGFAFLLVFNYLPMFGIVVAFKDMDRVLNITRALSTKPFIGLANFHAFLNDKEFMNIMMNTLGMNVLQLIIGFPAPIVFALLLNEVIHTDFKKIVQTITIQDPASYTWGQLPVTLRFSTIMKFVDESFILITDPGWAPVWIGNAADPQHATNCHPF
jgi:ABC-type polysaccharide transport system permease subunit